MNSVIAKIELIAEWSGRLVAWLVLGMALVTFAVVVLRYGFDLGWIALQESVVYAHALVFMLGASYTLKHNEHVRVDVLYGRLGPRGQAWVDLLGTLLLLLPVCLAILILSWGYVADSWGVREGSPQAGGLPGVWLLKSVIPLMAIGLLLQGLAGALRSIDLLRGRLGAE
ncbi:MAG: TRAP transporter small permease subunit [Gammaproteobacteria bacterium]|nr:TRAP transporter small permease subunit [Gammaproteobacteria bacterium]